MVDAGPPARRGSTMRIRRTFAAVCGTGFMLGSACTSAPQASAPQSGASQAGAPAAAARVDADPGAILNFLTVSTFTSLDPIVKKTNVEDPMLPVMYDSLILRDSNSKLM